MIVYNLALHAIYISFFLKIFKFLILKEFENVSDLDTFQVSEESRKQPLHKKIFLFYLSIKIIFYQIPQTHPSTR